MASAPRRGTPAPETGARHHARDEHDFRASTLLHRPARHGGRPGTGPGLPSREAAPAQPNAPWMGIVCGLDVTAAGGKAAVAPGYALGPDGDEIVIGQA